MVASRFLNDNNDCEHPYVSAALPDNCFISGVD